MPSITQKIAPCLWYDREAEDAAKFYCTVFKNSHIDNVSYYGKEGREIHGGEQGTVLSVAFTLEGQSFVALNGGPHFKFDEAVSFQVYCDTQEEVDYFWEKLSADGSEGPCGWLKDRFGLSWQVVPKALLEMMAAGGAKADRVMKAFLQMKKFDIAALERAYRGEAA